MYLILFIYVILTVRHGFAQGHSDAIQSSHNNYSVLYDTGINNYKQTGYIALACGPHDFTCTNKECISNSNECDGKPDCKDGSDETKYACQDNTCSDFLFRCSYGACIEKQLTCNGKNDCIDGSDERPGLCNKNCKKSDFICNNGDCIPSDEQCDGKVNCKDGSDETKFSCADNTCLDFLFRCSYGACVEKNLKCDGKNDCADGSDEKPEICNQKAVSCSSFDFKCGSGECISSSQECDGRADCNDASDELHNQCERSSCEEYLFRCRYGACISQDLVCDGKRHCYDSSDEESFLCRRRPDLEFTEGCVLPIIRNGGFRLVSTKTEKAHAGLIKPVGTSIIYFCNPPYTLKTRSLLFAACQNNLTWSHTVECALQCPPINSISQNVQYSVDVANGEPIIPGTVATLTCKEFYTPPVTEFNELVCDKDGRWNRPVYNCNPICGVDSTRVHGLIINGTNANLTDVPWNVGIYRTNPVMNEDHLHICGGTVITERLIFSAAHCFYDETLEGINPNNSYSIAVGKTYRQWYISKKSDPFQQLREVSEIQLKEEFKGLSKLYISDIAVIVLKIEDSLIFSSAVLPACLDFHKQYEKEAFQDGITGRVSGWGLTSSGGQRSSILKQIDVPYLSISVCDKLVPKSFRSILLLDKICAGFTNGAGVCEGDSGSGLLFRSNITKLWFLRGLVSVDPNYGGSCDPNSPTAYTSISFHFDWLKTFWLKFSQV